MHVTWVTQGRNRRGSATDPPRHLRRVDPLLPLGVGLLIGTAVVAALLVAGASAVHVAAVGLAVTAVALPTVWRWSQPTAVATGVSALMVMSLATGAALAPDGRPPTDDLPQQKPATSAPPVVASDRIGVL